MRHAALDQLCTLVGVFAKADGRRRATIPETHSPSKVGRIYIGQPDILLETLLPSSYLVMPQIGHLEQVFHIFGYLKARPKRKLGFEPAHPAINENWFQQCAWSEFYRDSEEAIPGNMPVARGNFMLKHFFVDLNHSGYTEIIQSQTVILVAHCATRALETRTSSL